MSKKSRKQNKKANMVAGNTHSNEGTTNNNQNKETEQTVQVKQTRKRQRKIYPFNEVMRDARTIFNRQLKQDGDVKVGSIELSLAKNSKYYPDKLRFELDFKAERDRLLDSAKFQRFCKIENLNPVYVADNILFEGKSYVNRTLDEGPQFLREKIRMFNCPLWKDTENLFSKEVDHE